MSSEAELISAMTPNGAVALAGSRGKGRPYAQSDFDFRFYADAYRGPEVRQTAAWRRFDAALRSWQAEGIRVDGAGMRSCDGVQRDLESWLADVVVPESFEWTIWGDHLLTDLASQQIIADPQGLLVSRRP